MGELTVIQAADVAPLVPYPSVDANKYTRGKAVIVGGSAEYPGAICLAARAANRCGAGYVEVYCSSLAKAALNASSPSIVARALDEVGQVCVELKTCRADHPQACLVGSGLSTTDASASTLLSLIDACAYPLVLDGGALSLIANEAGRTSLTERGQAGRTTVLTPHFGEACRLASALEEPPQVRDPFDETSVVVLAKALARAYRSFVVLKGPKTYLVSGCSDEKDPEVMVMDAGTPALAKAGSGDVLAGMCVSFMTQGLGAREGTMLATYVHACAARIASAHYGIVSVVPEDVVAMIPQALLSLA